MPTAKKPMLYEAPGRSNLQKVKIRQVTWLRDPQTGRRVPDAKSKRSSPGYLTWEKIKMLLVKKEKGEEQRNYFVHRLTTRRARKRETI